MAQPGTVAGDWPYSTTLSYRDKGAWFRKDRCTARLSFAQLPRCVTPAQGRR